MTEELWEMLGFDGMLNEAAWPTWDDAKCVDASIEIVVQVCGKIRARLSIAPDMPEEEVLALAKADPKVAAEIEGKQMVKQLYVKGKLVNLVVR